MFYNIHFGIIYFKILKLNKKYGVVNQQNIPKLSSDLKNSFESKLVVFVFVVHLFSMSTNFHETCYVPSKSVTSWEYIVHIVQWGIITIQIQWYYHALSKSNKLNSTVFACRVGVKQLFFILGNYGDHKCPLILQENLFCIKKIP